ncbi:MAG: holo-ACP synthase [Chromatiales bacterium]|nr:holo-ACP synthase [Chromatiales bacterium]
MIFGIGTDIVSVARMEQALERHGDRFAERILATSELDEFRQSNKPAHFLAKRFAAKEAAAKAFGTGFRYGLAMNDFLIGHDGLGRPLLQFTGKAEEYRKRNAIGESFLSISDENEHAVAFVTLLRC